MAAPRWWVPYITAGARRRGLDPNAVLAIASHEGLSGRVGDGGHAFGPFQMNDAGGVLTGRPGNHRAFAESRQGINAALDSMAKVARGLHGRAAVSAIATRYERPANPGAEISDAMAHYGHVSGGGGSSPGLALAGRLGASGGLPGASQGGAQNPMFAALLESSNELAAGHLPDPNTTIMALAAARQQAAQPSAPAQQLAGQVQGGGGAGTHGINELFYDPIGAIKNGSHIAAVGGHSDHVHVSLHSENAQKAAIAQAQRMGLHVGQDLNSNVTQVHVKDSYHYRHYRPGDPLREAADVSGNPNSMAAYYRWVARNYG